MRLVLTICFFATSVAFTQIDYICPLPAAKVKHMGLSFDQPKFKIEDSDWLGPVISSQSELKITLPNPTNLTTDNDEYKILVGFYIYNHKDSVIGATPDLYNGKTISTIWELNQLSFSLRFSRIERDSTPLKVVLFGKDCRTRDSFSIEFPVLVINDHIEPNSPFTTRSFYSYSAPHYKGTSNKWKINEIGKVNNNDSLQLEVYLHPKPEISYEQSGYYLSELQFYSKQGTKLHSLANAKLTKSKNNYLVSIPKNLIPTNATFLRLAIANSKDKNFVFACTYVVN